MFVKCVLSKADVNARTLTLDGKAYRSKAFVKDWADMLEEAKEDGKDVPIPVRVEFFKIGNLRVVNKIDFDTEASK